MTVYKQIKLILSSTIASVLLVLTVSSMADEGKLIKVSKRDGINQESIKAVQDKLQKTFTQLTVEDFAESPIPGIYQLTTNQRVIYYHPEKEMLIFGAIFSKDGRNLTQEHINVMQAKKIKDLPLDKALVLGDGEKTIIEFTDPDCPYCIKLHKYYMSGVGKHVKRLVFFSPITARHPNSPAKAIHILCSKDKEAAFDAVYSRQLAFNELKSCEEGKAILAEHETISKQFGVSGTPTVVLEDSVLPGFDQTRIAQFVNQK